MLKFSSEHILSEQMETAEDHCAQCTAHEVLYSGKRISVVEYMVVVLHIGSNCTHYFHPVYVNEHEKRMIKV